jgi:DNA (cytosine-5)-methyltransferase 1
LKFADGFAGAGGFRIALESLGHKCVWHCEIDKYCNQVYKYHWRDNNGAKDIRKVDPRTIPNHDLFCGGFPCQDFSIAGKREGIKGVRGTLFYEIVRLVKAKRPPYLLFENVKGLLSSGGGIDFGLILASLDEIGYDLQWEVLNSKNFGVPQNRERVFIIGHLRGQPRPKIFPIGENEKVPIGSDGPGPGQSQTQYSRTLEPKMRAEGTYIVHNHQKRGEGRPCIQNARRKGLPDPCGSGHLSRNDGLTYTLDTKIIQSLQIDNSIRRLTPIEYERLQGFPDNWTKWGIDTDDNTVEISDTQRYKMMGNAVTVNVVRAIGNRICDIDEYRAD